MLETPGPARHTVLLVEDDDALRSASARCLAGAGLEVAQAATGADALEAARALLPDVLVVDVMLPDAGGLGVARAVRRLRGLSGLPVLFTTALTSPAVPRLLAPDPVLFKPYTRAELVERVRALAAAAAARGGPVEAAAP